MQEYKQEVAKVVSLVKKWQNIYYPVLCKGNGWMSKGNNSDTEVFTSGIIDGVILKGKNLLPQEE